MKQFPGRSNRTRMIEELVSGKADEAVISGRVIGILDGEGVILGLPEDFVGEKGFILKDESEKIVVLSELLPGIGSIIEAKVVKAGAGKCRLVGEFEFLAECEDFYVSLRESPNYKKMVVDMNLAEKLKLRGKIVQGIRDYFLGLGFLETDTPCMVRLPGMEPYLDVFKTRFEANFDAAGKISEEMYLITSPEYAMKKLLVGGLEKIFQITKSFRNKESFSERHNPEFSILEWYRSYASYLEMMEDTEGLVKYLWDKYGQRDENVQLVKVKYKGHEVDVMQPWERLKVIDSFAKYAGISNEVFLDLEKLRAAVIGKGYKVDETTSFDDLFFLVFMNEIEPRLGLDKPVILYDYPVSMAALSKRCAEDVRFAERFEVYIAGLELCNAFTELNDPDEQFKRLSAEREERYKLGKDVYEVDKTFIEALKFGLPPAGGNALGVDRLIMLMLGEEDIRNVLFFPHRDL